MKTKSKNVKSSKSFTIHHDGRIEQRICANCGEEAGTMYVAFNKNYCEECTEYLRGDIK